eukprot:CFRG8489T1
MVINSFSEAAHRDGGENSSDVSKGGHDYTYVSPVPKCLCCAKCLLEVRDAVETNCGHMCCSECLEVWLQTPSMETACPVCSTELNPNNIRPSLLLPRQILDLRVCDGKAASENDIDSEGNNSPSAARQAPMESTTVESSNANPKADDMFWAAGTTESNFSSCDESMTVKEMLIYKSTCSFARVMCPAGREHRIVRANVDDHLQEKHIKKVQDLEETDETQIRVFMSQTLASLSDLDPTCTIDDHAINITSYECNTKWKEIFSKAGRPLISAVTKLFEILWKYKNTRAVHKADMVKFIIAVVALIYVVSPIDAIPDTIPVFGLVDDLIVAKSALRIILKIVERMSVAT